MRNNQKGQAALEFLTTYGWAFLVILVMIGALAGFGILTPSNFLPNRCNFASELPCDEHKLTSINADELQVQAVIVNSLGTSINIDTLSMSSSFGTGDFDTCTVEGIPVATAASLGPGKKATLDCRSVVGDEYPTGEKIKVQIELTYTPLGKTLSQSVSGEIFSKIQ